MKKILLFALVLLLSVSCTRDTHVHETYVFYDGAVVEVQYITILPRDWDAFYLFSNSDEGWAEATFRMSMITSRVINRGAVLCYFVDTNDVESPLPYIVTQVDGNAIFTNTLSFDVALGSIRFISENSDLVVEFPNRQMTIKVVTIVNP